MTMRFGRRVVRLYWDSDSPWRDWRWRCAAGECFLTMGRIFIVSHHA